MARIWVESYGCSASFADAEMISGMIVNGGHTLAANAKDSDLNLIVTCSVKDATANKMVNRIKRLKSKPLIVAGCLAKAEPKTVEKFSSGASMMGPNSIGKTLQIIDHALVGKRDVEPSDTDITKTGLPKVRLNPVVGIVEIASGCMSDCTFCQTKLARGDLKSYRIGDIVRQVTEEVKDGCKEIWLTSTDNGCYGLDIGTTLPRLVEAVSSIPSDFMVRVGMMNPMYMPKIKDDLLKSFESDKVYKFLHVPVQSGSDQVLHDMKRGHTEATFRDLVKKFRKKFEKFTVSTDVIVGFPTETESDFEKTLSLIKETRPDVVNLSRYSQRPGTKASEMTQIDVSEVKRRSKIVFDLMNHIATENNEKWVGWQGDVLFNEQTDEQVRGRNFAYKSVFVEDAVKVGQKKQVRITRVTNHGLYGVIAS
ncbi:tRNA (N(6)-L-threonylcarbamoyladenosine(37)-C(2))-methylthiotransferase [Candidatus Nitrosotenuis chungbukensis]|uniref:tRNA (N(6)-L-threonylcarbamoyladenosine(37)-C(2))- methylthiotransferase n=1 Tax=Candidatus Nitrosotenuis chungbukensis TaxID=1353246 RepID=UPI002671E880|nr:tRNA (N(6)-L-threonylcarbamoyladenosine(37)-C(2))-methylthiotransferase [Candidatus Nitrosotenuis chungbukensis]WKT57893.1 tRNA (N(6)-L-threonylcarbamoyladenosine(37)-C(2))-methylthiotransferase [Candidatus Nitrosotenuis chungbukensis]